mgnify:CR=1 FL=1
MRAQLHAVCKQALRKRYALSGAGIEEAGVAVEYHRSGHVTVLFDHEGMGVLYALKLGGAGGAAMDDADITIAATIGTSFL